MTKILRTDGELNEELTTQTAFLIKSCYDFDHGQHIEAKRISGILRTLLKDGGQSVSLLKQLDKKTEFLSYIYIMTSGLSTQQNFLVCSLTNPIHHYLPNFISDIIPKTEIPFEKWWTEVVIKDMDGKTFTRKKIILSVAEQDGGSHVDPAINEDYHNLTRANSQMVFISTEVFSGGFPAVFPKNALKPLLPPVWHTLRQIAHEVLETLGIEYQYDPRPFYEGVSIAGIELM